MNRRLRFQLALTLLAMTGALALLGGLDGTSLSGPLINGPTMSLSGYLK